jgi:hypothetical protein
VTLISSAQNITDAGLPEKFRPETPAKSGNPTVREFPECCFLESLITACFSLFAQIAAALQVILSAQVELSLQRSECFLIIGPHSL